MSKTTEILKEEEQNIMEIDEKLQQIAGRRKIGDKETILWMNVDDRQE